MTGTSKQDHRHDAGGRDSTQTIPSSKNHDDSIGRDHRTCSSSFMLQPPSPAEQVTTISSSSTSLHSSIHNGATTAGAAGPYTDYTRMTNNGSSSYYNNTSMWEPLPQRQQTTTSTRNAWSYWQQEGMNSPKYTSLSTHTNDFSYNPQHQHQQHDLQ